MIIEAKWSERPQTFRQCVENALAFLHHFQALNPHFPITWYRGIEERGKDNPLYKEQLEKSIPTVYPTIKNLFEHPNTAEESYREGGYQGAAWNGKMGNEQMGVCFSLGATVDREEIHSNICGVKLPHSGSAFYAHQDPKSFLKALARLMVNHWQPQIFSSYPGGGFRPPFDIKKIHAAIESKWKESES